MLDIRQTLLKKSCWKEWQILFSLKYIFLKQNKYNVLLGRKLLSFAVGKNGCETDCSQGCFSSHGKSHRKKSGERKIKNHKKKTIREGVKKSCNKFCHTGKSLAREKLKITKGKQLGKKSRKKFCHTGKSLAREILKITKRKNRGKIT